MQVGGVVPLAHALGAQADLYGVEAALQAGVEARGLAFRRADGRRACGRGDAATGFFEGQHFIKTAGAGQCLQNPQRSRTRRVVRTRTEFELCARMPVSPGRVGAQTGWHGVDKGLHPRPLAGAQRRTRTPGEVVFVHLGKVALAEVGQCVGVLLLRRALTDHAPNPAALFGTELRAPAQFVHLQRGFLVVRIGQADHGQRHQFARFGAHGGEFVVQILRGPLVNRIEALNPRWVQKANGLRGNLRPVVFHGEACAHPSHLGGQLVGFVERVERVGTALFGLAQRQPVGLHRGGHISAVAHKIGQR